MSEADIKSYLEVHGVRAVKAEQLCSRPGSPVSMHVEVLYEFKDTVMVSDFWTNGIRVSG